MALNENEKTHQALTKYYAPKPLGWRFWVWPRALLALVLLVLLLVVALLSLVFGIWQERHSPAPLSATHAPWESSCQTCHVTIETSSFLGVSTRPMVGKVDPQRCQTCHRGANHHTTCRNVEATCTTCHQEHRGRHAELTRMDDSHCTRCHQNLDSVSGGNPWPRFAASVRSFGAPPAHPPFRPWRPPLVVEVSRTVGLLSFPGGFAPVMTVLTLQAGRNLAVDPGHLEFDHALHLRPGLQREQDGKEVGPQLTYSSLPRGTGTLFTSLPEADQRRFGFDKDLNAAVKLECSTCHQLDRADARGDFWQLNRDDRPARGNGAYVLPVVYDQHCRLCHPLTFDTSPGMRNQWVPHPRQPDELRRWLRSTYAYLSGALQGKEMPATRHPSPGKRPDPVEPTDRKIIDDCVREAEKTLYRGKVVCGTCHQYDPPANPGNPLRIVPPQVPDVWFRHARFNHAVHRAGDCRICHPNAYAIDASGRRNPTASTRGHDVLIPGIGTCLQCHDGRASGGWQAARSDCVHCHSYHNRDASLSGVGSPTRDPDPRLDVQEFQFPWNRKR